MRKGICILLAAGIVAGFMSGCSRNVGRQKSAVQQVLETEILAEKADASGEAATLPDLTESRQVANPPCVMVDGVVYKDTGFVRSMAGCGTMDGEITSSVEATQYPAENNQSNFGTGMRYQRSTEGQLIVYVDDTPRIFRDINSADTSIPEEVLHFTAEVKEVQDGSLLVTYISTADGFQELPQGDYVISTDNLQDEVQVGDTVEVWFDGMIMETYPAQLSSVYRIARVSWNDAAEVDFTHDYSEEIKADVEDVASKSETLQKELEQIDTIIQKYTPLAEKAETQGEMNASSRWFYMIWDTELNHLWSRFMNLADQKTKESVLAEQRNLVAMKEEATLLSIGSREENGSIYPLLQNSFLEEITKNRSYVLASKLAGIKGEDFIMPDRSKKYGLFVDNQGTGDVYSALVTREGLNGESEAVISVYRTGETRGTFTDHGNGELAFTSDDGSVRGTIHIDGWKGASFRVTEVTGNSAFSIGEELEFPFAF